MTGKAKSELFDYVPGLRPRSHPRPSWESADFRAGCWGEHLAGLRGADLRRALDYGPLLRAGRYERRIHFGDLVDVWGGEPASLMDLTAYIWGPERAAVLTLYEAPSAEVMAVKLAAGREGAWRHRRACGLEFRGTTVLGGRFAELFRVSDQVKLRRFAERLRARLALGAPIVAYP